MEEEELPILTKKTESDQTDDGLPILKKKDEPGSDLPSSSASTEPGKQQGKSSQKSTPQNNWKAVSDAAKSISPIAGAVIDFGRKIASGFADELPQATAQGLEVLKSSVNPATTKEYIDRVPVDFQNYVREKEKLKWYQPFDQAKYIDKYADQFMIDTGREDIAKQIAKNNPEIIKRRKEVETFVETQKKEGAYKMAGAIQSYKDVKNLNDLASYIATLGGNAAYQIPLSVLTRGSSSLLQESATVYDQQLDRLAKENGISRQQVIEKGLDKPAEGQAYAVLAASLDKASAGNIIKAMKSGGGQLVKKWVNAAVPESVTEPAQGVLEDVGSGEKIVDALTSGKRIDEALGGIVGGSMGVINTTRQNLDKMDPTAIDAAGKNIEEALNTNEQEKTEETQQRTDAESQNGDQLQPESNIEGPEQIAQQQELQKDASGVDTPQQKANRELNDLVKSGAISREGNKVTIITEEGGREVKRIYDSLQENQSKQDEQTKQLSQQQEGQQDTAGGGQQTESISQGTVEQRQDAEQSILPSTRNEDTGSKNYLRNDEGTGKQSAKSNITDSSGELQQKEDGGGDVVIPPPSTQGKEVQSEQPDKKTYAIAKRILDSDADEAIKRGIKQKGAEYIPKGINITDKEANDLIELYGEEKSEALIRDTKNDLTGDTRTALAARLYERYKADAERVSDPKEKQRLYDRAVDIALTSAEQLKEAGRQANAAKIWKSITSNEDMTVMAIEKENQRQGTRMLETIYKQVKRSRQQFDQEIERIISERVTKGVEQQLARAKLITEEKKKQITDAFDALKIKDVKGTANDITRVLGATIWNNSIEAVKRAVLAGADLANAIQAGIDYVKQNHKGTWDEQEYKNAVSPAVEKMIPKESIQALDIDEKSIKTPKISGKQKKDFINQVVDAYNAGKLTDDKFEQLYAKQLGAREFSAEDRAKIRELAKTVAEVEKFEDQVKNDFTRENIDKYKKLLSDAQKANSDLQAYAQKPSNVWDTLISIMQGNLLTPLSLVTNVYSNTALQPLRFMSSGIGSLVDYSISKLAKAGILAQTYQNKTIDLTELQKGYFTGIWNGLNEGLRQIATGPRGEERNLREISSQFSPGRAVARWADGSRSTQQKVNDYIEGTIGWPAEAMFRLLNAGDKPFRRAAETARAMEIAKQKGLKGTESEKFLMFPDPDSQDAIKKAGDDATFQQESGSAKAVQQILSKLIDAIGKTPVLGGPLKVLAKSQIPYVKTPWNIMVETLKYAAFPVTGAVGIHQIAKGNQRQGSVLIGQAVVGAMIFAVAKELFSMGLLSWDEPYSKEEGKQRERRQLQYDNIPPNALNVSAIQRGLLGGDWSVKDDDMWVDYTKLGVVGLLFDNYTNNYFTNIKDDQQMPEESEFYVDMLTTAPRVLSQSLDQSFLKGTNAFLTALQDGGGYETEQWLINTTGAVAAIVYPNTLSTISKSSDEFIRDVRDDSFAEQLKNTYKTKLFIGEQLPPKVNLWGEKITGNPEGRDKYAYYLWDPTKFKNVDTEGWKYKLYTAWKESKFDDDYLPSIPKRKIKYRGVEIKLNPEQYEKMATYIGEQRRNLVSSYVASVGFDRKDKAAVLKRLKDLYEEGADRGKNRFLRDMGWKVMTPQKLSQIGKK